MGKNRKLKVCLVGSSGGHLTHLYMLDVYKRQILSIEKKIRHREQMKVRQMNGTGLYIYGRNNCEIKFRSSKRSYSHSECCLLYTSLGRSVSLQRTVCSILSSTAMMKKDTMTPVSYTHLSDVPSKGLYDLAGT